MIENNSLIFDDHVGIKFINILYDLEGINVFAQLFLPKIFLLVIIIIIIYYSYHIIIIIIIWLTIFGVKIIGQNKFFRS